MNERRCTYASYACPPPMHALWAVMYGVRVRVNEWSVGMSTAVKVRSTVDDRGRVCLGIDDLLTPHHPFSSVHLFHHSAQLLHGEGWMRWLQGAVLAGLFGRSASGVSLGKEHS